LQQQQIRATRVEGLPSFVKSDEGEKNDPRFGAGMTRQLMLHQFCQVADLGELLYDGHCVLN
jgi:hypothetical protein